MLRSSLPVFALTSDATELGHEFQVCCPTVEAFRQDLVGHLSGRDEDLVFIVWQSNMAMEKFHLNTV